MVTLAFDPLFCNESWVVFFNGKVGSYLFGLIDNIKSYGCPAMMSSYS